MQHFSPFFVFWVYRLYQSVCGVFGWMHLSWFFFFFSFVSPQLFSHEGGWGGVSLCSLWCCRVVGPLWRTGETRGPPTLHPNRPSEATPGLFGCMFVFEPFCVSAALGLNDVCRCLRSERIRRDEFHRGASERLPDHVITLYYWCCINWERKRETYFKPCK